jgi:hypothetical protein
MIEKYTLLLKVVMKMIHGHVLILFFTKRTVSVDEFQHKDREIICEVARMSKVVCSIRQSGDMKRILWLRFNPDSFAN